MRRWSHARCQVLTRAAGEGGASVGAVGDSFDNAIAESTIGQLKAELVHPCGPWRTIEQLEFVLLEYPDWRNHRRLHGEISMLTSVETPGAS